MGYEEVETVLPANFVPTPDAASEPAKEEKPADAAAPNASKENAGGNESEYESEAEDATCGGRRKKKRAGGGGRKSLLGRWRARSKSRSRGRKGGRDASAAGDAAEVTKAAAGAKSPGGRKMSFRGGGIKKNDSNVTEVASNTTSSKRKVEDDSREEEEEVAAINDNASSAGQLPTVREGSPANTTVTALTGDNSLEHKDAAAAATPPRAGGSVTSGNSGGEKSLAEFSVVEIGDETEQFEVPVALSVEVEETKKPVEEVSAPEIRQAPSADAASVRSGRSNRSVRSTRSTKSAKSTKSASASSVKDATSAAAAADDAASVRSTMSAKSTASAKSAKSTKSTSSKRSVGSKNKALLPAAVEEEEKKAEEGGPDNEEEEGEGAPKEKWVKKVSLSMGGYKTSFQFSDPMATITNAVNDALDVVGDDKALADQAKELDEINGEAKEEERDYDENPTRLFMYLQQRAWGLALTQLQKSPEEASVWVYRKAKPEKAPNVPDADENKGAMVVQHTAIVVHDGREAPKFRWKLLPLHAAIVLGAPTEIIQDIIRAYPAAAKKTDERGSLPVHLAASRLDVDPEGEKVVLQLFGAYPDSIEMQDRKGRTPPELAKLARARKEIEEERKINACTSQASQMGEEITASQYSRAKKKRSSVAEEDASSQDESGADDDDDDDDRSVKSSFSGRFAQLLKGSKSTDTADVRRKKKKGKKKKKGASLLRSAKSVDLDDDDGVADDASIAKSLGPGMSFVKTSKSQEVRDLNHATAEMADSKEDDDEEKELIVAAKKAIISREYQVPDEAPRDMLSPRNIPLPMSFSMNDDAGSVRSSRSSKSNRSSRSSKSSKTETSAAPLPPVPAPAPPAPASVPGPEEPAAVVAEAPAAKSVKIAEEPQVHEDVIPNGGSSGSSEADESTVKVNEGLQALLEKAVENAGRGGMDVTEFVKVLEDEWVTDVEALRRLDGETLDDLLPLMLSRELQRLINHADSIDNKFLKEDRDTLSRGRSPKKSKKKKKKRSHRRLKKRSFHRPASPPEGPLTTITEDDDDESPCESPGSDASDECLSIITEARTVISSAKSAPPKLATLEDAEEDAEEEPASPIEEQEEDVKEQQQGEGEEDEEASEDASEENDLAHSASIEDLEIRKLHANLIADARKKFPTREALEDSIRERQAEVEAAVRSGFNVDKETLARAALADDEVRKLLPLRLILPTVADLTEMISVLQMHKEGAMRQLDMDNARSVQSEIDELQEQIEKEEKYLLTKRLIGLNGETKCSECGTLFPTEKKMNGILRTTVKKCEGCRSERAPIIVETVESKED